MSKTELDNKIKSVNSSVKDTMHMEIKNTPYESTEEALKANANRFRAIFDQTAVGVAQIKTTTGNFVMVNKRYCDIVGYTQEEMNKTSFMEITHPDDLITDLDNMLRLVDGKIKGFTMEKRYRHKDGSTVWVNLTVSPMWDVGDKPDSHIAVVEDITERKQIEVKLKDLNKNLEQQVEERTAELSELNKILKKDITERKHTEEALKNSKQLLQLLMDSALEHIIAVNKDGVIMFLNRATATFLGGEPKDIAGKHLDDFLPEKTAKEWMHFHSMILQSGVGEFKEDSYTVGGKTLWLYTNSQPVRNHSGENEMVLNVSSDITDRKKSEKVLKEQKEALEQKNTALNEVLGQIEIEKKRIKDNVIANAENLLLPIIEKISLKDQSSEYIPILKRNLLELTSSFGARLSDKKAKLTPREIDICNMIKNGLTSKEMADLLNISPQTIEKHRAHIRKKLGIVNKKLNLPVVLKTI